MMNILSWIQDTNGATAVEYGLLAAGVALTIVASVFAFGDQLETLYTGLSSVLD